MLSNYWLSGAPANPTAGDGKIILPEYGGEPPNYDRPGDDALRYREYQVDWILPYVGESILYVGAGTGDLAALLMERAKSRLRRLVLTDTDPRAVAHLQSRFPKDRFPEVEVHLLHLPDSGVVGEIPGKFDTVLLVNGLGHIDQDRRAVKDLTRMLDPYGRIVVWDAADPKLFTRFDFRTGLFRRYTPEMLSLVLESAGLEVENRRSLNLLGWYFCRITRSRTTGLADRQLVRLYDRLMMPITRRFDDRSHERGQNVFAVAFLPAGSEN